MSETSTPEHVRVFDTTLRDGEQTPFANFTASDKLAIAERLVELGVDVIEAGFPGSEEGEFESVRTIAETLGDRVVISGFGRAHLADVEIAGEAIRPALVYGNARIHTGIGTSPSHMKYKFRKSPDEILTSIWENVSRAREFTPDVQFYAEDASRSDPAFLIRALQEAVEAGATSVMVPDTVGIATPARYASLMRLVRGKLDHSFGEGVVGLAAHCHDDLGNATMNTLWAVAAGVDEVQVAAGGLGERAGNARLETVAINLRLYGDQYGNRDTRLHMKLLTPIIQEIMQRAGVPLPGGAAIVGSNAFTHESGIHQDGVRKHPEAYEWGDPHLVGQKRKFTNGSRSGKAGAELRLANLGLEVNDETLEAVSARVKEIAQREGRNYVDSDVETAYAELQGETLVDRITLENWTISKSKGKLSAAEVLINGKPYSGESEGGELDALVAAIYEGTGIRISVGNWEPHAEGSTDADVRIRAEIKDDEGNMVEVDVHSQSSIEALVEACEKGLNMLCRLEERAGAATRTAPGPEA